jgi:hypothetical protein
LSAWYIIVKSLGSDTHHKIFTRQKPFKEYLCLYHRTQYEHHKHQHEHSVYQHEHVYHRLL